MNGKGSKRRPAQVSDTEITRRWDRTFKRKSQRTESAAPVKKTIDDPPPPVRR